MLTEDYILRQISLLTAVLAKVAGLNRAGKYQEARGVIDQAVEEMLGLNASIINQMDETGLINLLTTLNGLDSAKAFVVANLIEAEGDTFALQGREDESRQCHQRALNLLLEVTSQSPAGLEKELAQKIDELEIKLSATG